MVGIRVITMEFDNKRFWKFTMALGRKLSGGRLFFYKITTDSEPAPTLYFEVWSSPWKITGKSFHHCVNSIATLRTMHGKKYQIYKIK